MLQVAKKWQFKTVPCSWVQKSLWETYTISAESKEEEEEVDVGAIFSSHGLKNKSPSHGLCAFFSL